MTEELAIAIETSHRGGSVAAGAVAAPKGADAAPAAAAGAAGGAAAPCVRLWEQVDFDASRGHATQLVPRLEELLSRHGKAAADVRQVYVSAGPGSYTGLRVGITAARTLCQATGARCVAVPTAWAVAMNAAELAWEHLAVALDGGEGELYVQYFTRGGQGRASSETACAEPSTRTSRVEEPAHPTLTPAGEAALVAPAAFLAQAPRGLMLLGEALNHHDLAGEGIERRPDLSGPKAAAVFAIGAHLAAAGRFTDWRTLQPIYTRLPSAVLQWDRRREAGK